MANTMEFSGLFNKSFLPYMAQPQLLYAYFEARPGGGTRGASTARLPLNFSLVLDRSGSMSGPKITQLREAVRTLIGRLEPTDTVAVVAFNAHSDVLIPATNAGNRAVLSERIGRLEAGGGTKMAPAMRAGLAEIAKARPSHLSSAVASRLIVLTDGQTTGEDDCRAEADRVAAAGVPLIALGLGSDWNEDLLLDLARRTGALGDAFLMKGPEDVGPIFDQVFTQMKVVAQDVAFRLLLVQGVEARRVWQVTPLIKDITFGAVRGRTVTFGLPELAESGAAFLVELLIPPRNPGQYRFAQAQATYHLPGQPAEEARVDLTAEVTTDPNLARGVNGRVMNIVEKVTAFKLQTQALDDAARQDIANATRKLRAAHTMLLEQGEVELAQNALAEAERLESGQGL
ncbi:MAG TPA: VWA domain-containing protein, partial [Promineifilum sp.]|nr:VWA domain-containing protein [Promineifilum sp.]